ncbi:MAG: AzlD domain-containing protein [Sulfuritalea sp.]|nr:AzlD domain-containing protein [Sulfuritalea sp.]
MNLWVLMLVCGLLTFAIRYSFIAAEGHYQPPPWFRRLLPFVPIAALTALVAPELLLMQGELVLGSGNLRLWAGLAAIVVAAVWRNTLLTIGSGFLALFLLQRLAG